MTCITSVDGMTEECILSSPGAGFDGSVEAWYVRVRVTRVDRGVVYMYKG